jgi:hypothetical protein
VLSGCAGQQSVFDRGPRGANCLNLLPMFLLFRRDRVLTAQRGDQDRAMVVGLLPWLRRRATRRFLPTPTPRRIDVLDSTSRGGSGQAAALGYVFHHGVARECGDCTTPADIEQSTTAALAGNASLQPVPLRSCGSAPSEAVSSRLAVQVGPAQSVTWRMPLMAQLILAPLTPSQALTVCDDAPQRAPAIRARLGSR